MSEKNNKVNIDVSDFKGKKPEEIGTLIIEKVLKIPYVKVNREEFLRDILKDKVSQAELESAVKDGTSAAGIPLEIIKNAANDCISTAKNNSTIESAITGIPGGVIGISAGILVDLIQFYANLINLIQKLAYLYGMKDIDSYPVFSDNKDRSSAIIILLFLGAASGVEGATVATKAISKSMQKQYTKQASKLLLIAKPTFYSIAKKIAKMIGLSISKKGFAKSAAKVVPIVGAGVSAVLNWVTFVPFANKTNSLLCEIYDKPFDEKWIKQMEALEKGNYFYESAESIKKNSIAYCKNDKTVKERKRDTVSQECLDFIKELCDEAIFCKPDESIFKLVNVNKEDCFVCHDDTKKSHSRGFVITSEGIHSFIDEKRGYRFISFKELSEITGFVTHTHKSPLNSHKFIEGRKNNVEIIPILPYEMIRGGYKTMFSFLRAIRNACWVDMYL